MDEEQGRNDLRLDGGGDIAPGALPSSSQPARSTTFPLDDTTSNSKCCTGNEDWRFSQSYHTRPSKTEHLGRHRQYWRDIILGVNDGLVSTFLLVAGVVGGGFGTTAVLLTAISGGIAGAVSMAAGEFIATKSQDEVLRGEIALEDTHIRNYHKDEMKELGDLLHKIGLDRKKSRGDDDGDESSLMSRIIRHYEQDDEALLKVMIALEFGVIEEERRSPFLAGAVSFGLFLCGALFSIVPFSIVDTPTIGLVASAIATAIGLLLVGCFKTWATRGKWYRAAMENLFIAAGGGALAYGIGAGFEHAMRK